MDVRAIRAATGLSQARFAADFGISIGTLRDWEQGRKQPDGPARTLLRVIEREPVAVRAALETAAAPARQAADWLEHYLDQLRVDRPDLDPDVFLFRASVTRIAATMDTEFRTMARRQLAIGVGELRILMALRRESPDYTLRLAGLAPHMLVTSGAFSKQVQRLEKRRLIRRLKQFGGEAGLFVQLTPRGHRLVTAAIAHSRSAYTISVPAFERAGDVDRASALRFLRRVVAETEAGRGAPAAQVAPSGASSSRR
jgi:DNA-binding MarR family transcriptional regulator